MLQKRNPRCHIPQFLEVKTGCSTKRFNLLYCMCLNSKGLLQYPFPWPQTQQWPQYLAQAKIPGRPIGKTDTNVSFWIQMLTRPLQVLRQVFRTKVTHQTKHKNVVKFLCWGRPIADFSYRALCNGYNALSQHRRRYISRVVSKGGGFFMQCLI
ncbi:hypothetical protein Halhy_3692 [Haliscomenobacter hydrossis DSM 1100]|uniref:Uncharacterized protein n=1 Tax=Haliscomenobacter hydrossis (strain ATCC 27775 / DSM 1100 / LMG 10767 / O) TaxID=760192 RepID=F4KZX4_HALH1|nr:hypothetical protein Halhy_3692 [Haliscomenobacter hydrossis DSM 1100]